MRYTILVCLLLSVSTGWTQNNRIDLSGTWLFAIDSTDSGIEEQWYAKKLPQTIQLPGSMTTNNKGEDIRVNTPWTGSIFDSSWFVKPQYAAYRRPGNIKIPFWLQPVKYYKGAAWYQKTVTIPANWKGRSCELYIERAHWETTVWIDNRKVGMENSLGTPHVYDLTKILTPGVHRITVRVDNRVKDIDVGQNSHSISDHTQSNWNGMIGELSLRSRPAMTLDKVHVFPDITNKQVRVQVEVKNPSKATIQLQVVSAHDTLPPVRRNITGATMDFIYPMGEQPLLWDEFNPNLYELKVQLNTDVKKVTFGMREWASKGTRFTINGKPVFLRGTLECAIFPRTGYPPTDVASWQQIFKVCKSYGLNHIRFHSWTPPRAAFEAADQAGMYLQVECSSWANQGATIGDGAPLDKYIYRESERVVDEYGNHPSFVMMAYGNEPGGKHHVAFLEKFVAYWKAKDKRRAYTTGAGWPISPVSDYNNSPTPRIQRWGEGLKSIINAQPPRTDFDWAKIIKDWKQPAVSHEIGQWCVYPDFKEISKYTGVLKAKNFEIFRDRLQANGLQHLADSFLLASGKLQVLCYKADIEAALRTPGFGGFQLLDLHDFPGQGTALVGVLNPFWEDKGYVTGATYSRFCNVVVPLARFPKMVFTNDETLSVPVEVAQFSGNTMNNLTPTWTISDIHDQVLFKGALPATNIPLGNGIRLGTIQQSLETINEPSRLVLSVELGDFENNWDFFVYPAKQQKVDDHILVTHQLDAKAQELLKNGGKVLLTLKKGTLQPAVGGDIAIGFSSIFWNTAWTNGQPPTTLGILCNPAHPAFKEFPTQYHSNWQWWDAMSHSNAILLDSVAKGLQPIVRVIDDWVTARSLGLVFECKVGKGKMLVSGIDLLTDVDKRPEARQLLYSLGKYMETGQFAPAATISMEKISHLVAGN